MNNGEPINPSYEDSDAKSPSICINNQFNLIYIVYQTDDNSYPANGIVIQQFGNYQLANTPNWTNTISSQSYPLNINYAPVVASMSSAGMVVIDPPSSSGTVGLRAFKFTIELVPGSNGIYDFTGVSEITIPGINQSSASPSITSGDQKYHLVYEQSQSTIKYLRYLDGNSFIFHSNVSTGSATIKNLRPVISLIHGLNPIVSWIGGVPDIYHGGYIIYNQIVSRVGPNWGSFISIYANTASTVNNNSTNEYGYENKSVIAYTYINANIPTTKWFRRDENGTYSTPAFLDHSGIWPQVTSASSINGIKALVFSDYGYFPYYFLQSETDFAGQPYSPTGGFSKITETDTIVTFGRSGVAVINDIEFAFEIGDILVGDSIINFIQVPDTIVYTSSNESNERTRTENFILTPETQFYFTNIYYVVQKANPDSALTNTDAVNFKAELVNSVTSQVVGTFDNVTYHKNNLLKHNNIDYLVDCSGITPGEYYLRLVTTVTGNAEYVMANIVNDNTTLAKKNYNTVNFKGTEIPETYALEQNFPNPFNPTTTIRYQIPKDGLVTLKIYDILGAEVATLVNEEKVTGKYEVTFNASKLASSVYIYTIKSNDFTASKKLMLLK